jgi:hypothetical protein
LRQKTGRLAGELIPGYPFKPGQPLTHTAPVDPVEAFRGKGKGGATARLLQDRQKSLLAIMEAIPGSGGDFEFYPSTISENDLKPADFVI